MFNADDLGQFGNLSRAIGLTDESGPISTWFEDPMGDSHPNGLKHILTSAGQRDALIEFVDEVLGPPAARVTGTQKWVPLFQNPDPNITLSAVIEALPGSVRLGVGFEHATGTTAPFVTTRLHVPLIHVPNGADDDRPSGDGPEWLLIGQVGGRIGLELDARFTDDSPVPGEAYLRGAAVRLDIPTNGADHIEFGLDLIDLQVPGATTPTTQSLDIDNLDEVGTDVLDFVVGLIRAQAAALDLGDPTFRHIAGLTGILGLREVADLPALPIADLPVRGPSALVDWVEEVLGDGDARDAWIGELARLVGGTPLPSDDAVEFDLGDVAVRVGVRVTPGVGGQSMLVPWATLVYGTRSGVSVGGGVDLFRLDTATGAIRAIPTLRAQAVFGADSATGAARLIDTGPVQIGSVHVGVRVDDATEPGLARPAFALTLHDVDIVAGGSPRHHELLDLSTPDAALDALDSAVDSAISSALDTLGSVGDLLKILIGVDPPTGVPDIALADLLTDPIAAITAYYRSLVDTPAAMGEVLSAMQALITGATTAVAVPGTGSHADPWRLTMAVVGGGAGVGLAVWSVGRRLSVAVSADIATGIFDELEVAADLRLIVLAADLDAGTLSIASEGEGRLLVRPTAAGAAEFDFGVAALRFDGVGVRVSWSAGRGIRIDPEGVGLALVVDQVAGRGPGGLVSGEPVTIGIPLPAFDPSGGVTWSPDWDDVEVLLGRLLSGPGIPILDAAVGLLGWAPVSEARVALSARLSLAALIADPAAELRSWAAEMMLECDHLQAAMNVTTQLLSGFALDRAYGLGRTDLPYRAPVAGEVAAPAIIAWTVPPCPPPPPAQHGGAFEIVNALEGGHDSDNVMDIGGTLVEALRSAATSVPGLDDMLFARTDLAAGLDQLVARWAGTDGVIGPPGALPEGVDQVVLPGYGYSELAALARSSSEFVAGLTPAAVVHVGCEDGWGRGTAIDATGGTTGSSPPPTTVAAAGPGTWFVQVATPMRAAATRSDGDAVAAQAALLIAAIGGRTDPITVVGYDAAGAAAIRAASTTPAVAAVVTVGTPWSPVSVTAFQTGVGASALELCHRLLPAVDEWPDDLLAMQATPLVRGADLVRRAIGVPAASALPSAGAEPIRTGLDVRAVFGVVDVSTAAIALASLIATAVVERAEAAIDETADLAVARPDHLHVGIDVPAMQADIGGLSVGAGARLELLHVARNGVGPPTIEAVRELVVTMQLGVRNGWLVGGPGASTRDIEVRWLEAEVHLPISIDGTTSAPTGFTEIVLHDARALGVFRERWVVRADGETVVSGDVTAATVALPELKVLIGEVIGRVRDAVPNLSGLFEAVGLIRLGGLDPGALDRLLFDPGGTVRPVVAAAPTALAGAINDLIGAVPDVTRPPTAIDLGVSGALVRFDLAARSVAAVATVTIDGVPPLTITADVGPGTATASVRLGSLDPELGGVAVRLDAALGTGLSLVVDHRRPADPSDVTATRSVPLYPAPDIDGVVRVAATLLPAALAQATATELRRRASDEGRIALDAALDAIACGPPQ